YRGVGTFSLPIAAKAIEDGKILINKTGRDPVDGLILFENRKGTQRYQLVGRLQNERTVDSTSLRGNVSDLSADLGRILIEQVLYPKEARAMIETWRDSWFDEGTRLFYIVPKATIDSILPLQIQPSPSSSARVFVGRMEIITPAVEH